MTGSNVTGGRIEVALSRDRDFSLDVAFDLARSGVTVLFGPSGCGKTTILRCAAGLDRGVGRVQIGHRLWQDDTQKLFIPTYQRRLGYVFQEASLFEHLNVRRNLQYALHREHDGAAQTRLDEAVQLLGIGHLLDRRVTELSGGERQRCAIARSLVVRPDALLMDEPLAALDHARRQEILPWIETIRKELNIPILYVTHSEEELLRLADKVVVLQAGRILAQGSVDTVYGDLSNGLELGGDAVAIIETVLASRDPQWNLMRVVCGQASFWVQDRSELRFGQDVRLRIQASDVSITRVQPQQTSIQNVLPCRVVQMQPAKNDSQLFLRLQAEGCSLVARVTRRAVAQLGIELGSELWAQIKSVSIAD